MGDLGGTTAGGGDRGGDGDEPRDGGGAPTGAAAPDDVDLTLVLLGLRLTSFAPAERVAAVVGLDADGVAPGLAAAAERGLAKHRDGRLSGWIITPAGRAEGERLLAAQLDATGRREAVHGAYRRFLELNTPCLELCTDWQLRTAGDVQEVNDHTDAAYDAAVIARLGDLADRLAPVLTELGAALERFDGYPARFAAARRRVERGEVEWFTRPDIDSFHTVWFELHEHLLATLGIERRSESAPS